MAQLTFQRARTEEKKRQRAEALVEAARSLALETGVASVTLTAARAGTRRVGVEIPAGVKDCESASGRGWNTSR